MTQTIGKVLGVVGIATLAGCSSNRYHGTTVAYDSGYTTSPSYVVTADDDTYTTPAYDRSSVVVTEIPDTTVYTTPVTRSTTVTTTPRDTVYGTPRNTTQSSAQFRPVNLRTSRSEITLDEFRRHVNSQSAIIIDAREPKHFSKGHVRGAINIPSGDEDSYIAKFRRDVSPDQLIIVYCGGPDCPAGDNVATYLSSQGYTNLRVYHPGWQQLSNTDLD